MNQLMELWRAVSAIKDILLILTVTVHHAFLDVAFVAIQTIIFAFRVHWDSMPLQTIFARHALQIVSAAQN